jgi:hypothetical protein
MEFLESPRVTVRSLEQPPTFLGGLHQLEDHGETRLSRAISFGATMQQPHCGKRALDGVGRAQVTPVLGREVVEREQRVAIPRQTSGGFIVLGLVGVTSFDFLYQRL